MFGLYNLENFELLVLYNLGNFRKAKRFDPLTEFC
jgi:hypothetical protein